MTPAEGIKKLKKIVGARAYWRDYGRPSSPEEREERQAIRLALREEVEAIEKDITARLEALDWYRERRARQAAIRTQLKALPVMPYYRLEVGHVDKILGAFHIDASADNWADAIRKLEAREAEHKTGRLA